MTWKTSSVVDERMRFICALRDSDESFSQLCAQFGISRKTGYKWVERYEAGGPQALNNEPSGPKSSKFSTPAPIVARLLEARKLHPRWGPKKLRAWLLHNDSSLVLPAPSTIGELLKRHGLIASVRRRRPRAPFTRSSLSACDRPNAVWCVDFKGHFALGNGARCYPLTLSDGFSRYLLKCEALSRTRFQDVQPHFECAFREFGLPLRIRSDNGPPFSTVAPGGLSELSVWWIRLGIVPELIEPAHPEQNGRHERMHRTLLEVCDPPANDHLLQQLAFDRWRREFNEERPHEALEQTPPGRSYSHSPRAMPTEGQCPVYPPDWKVRWVDKKGELSFEGREVRVGPVLAREPIGLEQQGETLWHAWYGPVRLGSLDTRNPTLKLQAIPRAGEIEAIGKGFQKWVF